MRVSRRLVGRLGVAGAFLALIGLGTWQVERLEWKEALIAERASRVAAPPLASFEGAEEFRRIRLSGRLLTDRALSVLPRGRRVVPLALPDGSHVLVETAEAVPGPATVTGVLRAPQRGGAFVPDNDPVKGDWFRIDPAAMGAALGLERVRTWWVQTSPLVPIANDHLQYAITWYSLAVILIVIYLLARRKFAHP